MAQKHQIVRDCDRCATSRRAEETVRLSYDGNNYEIDVCRTHADMLDRDMRGWTRLARELESPFGKNTLALTDIEREQLRRPSRTPLRPAKPVAVVPPEVEDDDEVELAEFAIWPTEAAITAMQAENVAWPKVVESIRHPVAIRSTERDDVSIYLTKDLQILLSEDHHVLGVTTRDPGQDLPPEQSSKPIVRKGKRGGIGNVGPRDYAAVLKAIQDTPGWRLERGGKHYKVIGPQGQNVSIPITPSGYRTPLATVARLRAIGLDLREPTQTQSA